MACGYPRGDWWSRWRFHFRRSANAPPSAILEFLPVRRQPVYFKNSAAHPGRHPLPEKVLSVEFASDLRFHGDYRDLLSTAPIWRTCTGTSLICAVATVTGVAGKPPRPGPFPEGAAALQPS